MSPSLPDDHYKHNLFIHHYCYNYFQASHVYRNKTINYKKIYSINLFKMNNFHL